jgi:Sec-independent protein translocase protein TatA
LCSDENEQPEGTLASHFTINYMNYPGVTKSDEISALAQALKELPKLTSDVKQKYDQQLKAQFIKEMGLDKDLSPQLYKDLGITTGQLPSWQQLNNYFDQVDKEEKEAVVKIEQEAAKNLA